CMMFWPYSIYYLISNIEETWKPFLIECLGGVLVTLSLCGGVLWDKEDFAPRNGSGFVDPQADDADPDDGAPPGMPAVPPGKKPPRGNRRRRSSSQSDGRERQFPELLGEPFGGVVNSPAGGLPLAGRSSGGAGSGTGLNVGLGLRFSPAGPQGDAGIWS